MTARASRRTLCDQTERLHRAENSLATGTQAAALPDVALLIFAILHHRMLPENQPVPSFQRPHAHSLGRAAAVAARRLLDGARTRLRMLRVLPSRPHQLPLPSPTRAQAQQPARSRRGPARAGARRDSQGKKKTTRKPRNPPQTASVSWCSAEEIKDVSTEVARGL